MKTLLLSILAGWIGFGAGCSSPAAGLRLSGDYLQDRALQTRSFESSDQQQVLAAAARVLQDLGFLLEEGDTELGLVVGLKTRSAVVASQQIGAVLLAVLGIPTATDNNQTFWISVTTKPVGPDQVMVRVKFYREIRDTTKSVVQKEPLEEPALYRDFFARLAKALFLEEQQI